MTRRDDAAARAGMIGEGEVRMDETGANARIRIGIVDNDPYAVAVLSTMIARMDARFDVAWTCELGAVAISRCLSRTQRPDVLVTDMSMNDVPGTEVCRAIRVKRADVGVVGVTSYAVASFRDEAVHCGMQALVGKTDLAGMAAAIRRAAHGLATNVGDDDRTTVLDNAVDARNAEETGGARFLDSAEAHTLLEDASYDAGGARGALSPKERDVLRLYADGLTTREIADRLGVGTSTVSTFERRALAKLGARSRAHAISICVRRHVF
ncbi:response regulator transcription factor [Bifidobacterium biavatii]|nr:response regulator transcription factor [Bifidobacterium biavatii]